MLFLIAFKEWKWKVHLKSLIIGVNTNADVVHTKEGRFTVNNMHYAITMFLLIVEFPKCDVLPTNPYSKSILAPELATSM